MQIVWHHLCGWLNRNIFFFLSLCLFIFTLPPGAYITLKTMPLSHVIQSKNILIITVYLHSFSRFYFSFTLSIFNKFCFDVIVIVIFISVSLRLTVIGQSPKYREKKFKFISNKLQLKLFCSQSSRWFGKLIHVLFTSFTFQFYDWKEFIKEKTTRTTGTRNVSSQQQ